MNHWLGRGADGWRLDAAYAVPTTFWAQVLPRVRAEHPDAWFVAEVIHGDYPAFVQESTVDSVTQYELWKAIWSSHQRRQPVGAGLVADAARRVPRVVRAADVRRQPRHHAHREHHRGPPPPGARGRGAAARWAAPRRSTRATSWGSPGSRRSARVATTPSARSSHADGPGDDDNPVLRLHQELIGLRRRHPWLHRRAHHAGRAHQHHVRLRGARRRRRAARRAEPGRRAAARPGGEVLASDDDTRGRSDVAPHGWAVVAP